MKFYEIEFLKKNRNYKEIIRAKNLNTAQAKALSKNWTILNIEELKNQIFKD